MSEGKIARRTVVSNVHALAMLSEIKRIGPCVVPDEEQKPPPDLASPWNAIALRASVWWKCDSAIYSKQRVLVRTSSCGTFDPRASSNVSFAPIVLKKSAN